jgi:hypothetical protein
MESQPADRCMKRRLLQASSEAYQGVAPEAPGAVGWIEPPVVIRRNAEIGRRLIDQALVGRVREGVVVAIRGSLPPFPRGGQDGFAVLLDWLSDSLALCVEAPEYGGGVHLGFADSMYRLWEDADGKPGIRRAIQMMLDVNRFDHAARPHLFLTGHSKGGALANLAALRAARLAEWHKLPISVATIAAPRAGNAAFARSYAAERISCLRYEIASDIVPHLPPGPQTPRWLRRMVHDLVPRLALSDYHAVGVRVSGERRERGWAGAWLAYLAGMFSRDGLRVVLHSPSALAAHAISPQSTYDRLICRGEVGCTHH